MRELDFDPKRSAQVYSLNGIAKRKPRPEFWENGNVVMDDFAQVLVKQEGIR